MKKTLLAVAVMGAFGFSHAQEIENPLVKKLYEKGVITKEEAVELDEKLYNKEEESVKADVRIEKEAVKAGEEVKKLKKKLKKISPIKSKAKWFKFDGVAYLGYTFTDRKYGGDGGDFEIRRGYSVLKAYFNDKDYFRVTLDVSNKPHKPGKNEGNELDVKFKHLYLYKDLSKLIPHTGVELGLVHTPWLDFEEHSGWWYRSISKTFYESSDGAHMLPSADLGVDFKTKTEHFSAEYGIFNGEGYDHIRRQDKGDKPYNVSLEGRFTWHIFGGGTLRYIRGSGKVPKLNPRKDTYTNISLHVVDSINHRGANNDLNIYQFHVVYNQPLFLIAGQYIKSHWINSNEATGKGYSFNFELRPTSDRKISLFGRYDYWKPENPQDLKSGSSVVGSWEKRNQYIYGIAYKYNKYVTFILNGITADYDETLTSLPKVSKDYTKYMITADVEF